MGRNSGGIRSSSTRLAEATRQSKSEAASSKLQKFADEVISDGVKRGREMVVGSISKTISADMQKKGVTLQTTDVVIDDGVIVKYIAHVKTSKGASIDRKKYWMVEKTLKNPTAIYEDTEQKYLVYVNTRAYGKGKVLKVVVHPNFSHKGRTYNLLKSIGVVNKEDMNGKQYRKIK